MFFRKLFKKKGSETPPNFPSAFNVTVIGDRTSYSLSFLETFVEGKPSDYSKYRRPDLEFRKKEVKISDDKTATLNVWDVNSKLKSDASPYFMRADGIILYFNPSNKETFESIKVVAEGSREILSERKVPIQIVCVSEDKEEGENEHTKTPVAQEEVEEFAKSIGGNVSTFRLDDMDRIAVVFETLAISMSRTREQAEESANREGTRKVMVLPEPTTEAGNSDSFKVVVVGNDKSGRTSLQMHYVSDSEYDTYTSSGTTYLKTLVGKTVKLVICDIVEKDPMYLFPKTYLNGVCINIACCDTTDPKALDQAREWISQLERYGSGGASTVIAGTKSDLASPENLTAIREQIGPLGTPFVVCSAKTGAGMDELLEKVLEVIEAKVGTNFGMAEKGTKGKKSKPKK